jgi:hypothetical protein
LDTVTQTKRPKSLGLKVKKNINNLAQVNAYESLFQSLTQKPGLQEDLPGNALMINHKEKIVLITPAGKPALETIKKMV